MKSHAFFDLDNMIFDTHPGIVQFINCFYNINSILSDYNNNPSLEKVVNKYRPQKPVTYKQAYKDFFDHFLTSQEKHANVKPFKDAPEVLKQISKKFKIYIVTARQKGGDSIVQYLLDSHIPNCVSEIHYVWHVAPEGQYEEITKKDFIISQGMFGEGVAFFDDSLKEVEAVRKAVEFVGGSLVSYHFDPYDIHTGGDKERKVKNWKQIGDLLLK
jgi:hypothetical protein